MRARMRASRRHRCAFESWGRRVARERDCWVREKVGANRVHDIAVIHSIDNESKAEQHCRVRNTQTNTTLHSTTHIINAHISGDY
jgi:hypothetical protein